MNSVALVLLLLTADPEARAVITDRHGGPVPERVQPGSFLILSAKQSIYGDNARSILWRVSPASVAARSESLVVLEPDGTRTPVYLIPVGTAQQTIEVDLVVAKGDAADVKSLTIIVGDGTDPRPPPDEETDPPDPPRPPAQRLGKVLLIYEPKTITPAAAIIVNATPWWQEKFPDKWQIFLASSAAEEVQLSNLAAAAHKPNQVKPPYLAIWNDKGSLSGVVPLPARLDQVPAAVDGVLRAEQMNAALEVIGDAGFMGIK